MTRNHLKRLAAPKTWAIPRKGKVFITRPKAGPHAMDDSLPLSVLLREVTRHANTLKEVKFILNNGTVLIDGKRCKEPKFPVGYFDVLCMKESKEHFRVAFDENGKVTAFSISEKEAELKPCKIIAKTAVSGGKVQLNLYDGKNLISNDEKYKVGDTLVVNFKNEVLDHLPLKKGMLVYFTSGKHMATLGTIEEVEGKTVVFSRDGQSYRTSKDYAFVVGKDKPIIKLQ